MIRGLKKDVETGSDEIPNTVQKKMQKFLKKYLVVWKKGFTFALTHVKETRRDFFKRFFELLVEFERKCSIYLSNPLEELSSQALTKH